MSAARLSFLIVPAVLLSGLISPVLAASSQAGISLQISPLPIELNAKPGASVSTDLRVRNAGSQTEKLQVRLLRVSADDNGNIHLASPASGDEWVRWVHFSRTVFDAPPGQWQTIHMNIDLPKSAAFGYYFAVEYLRANAEQPRPGQAVTRGAVATFILLNAQAPGAKRQAQIVSFSADKKSYEFLPASFTIKVRSTGNVHVAPHGNIFILKGHKQVGSVVVNAAGGNILPGSSRYFSAQWDEGFPAYVPKTDDAGNPVIGKDGKAETSLKWDFSHANRLRFGHYTAHLVMIYDNGQRDVPLDAYVSFWVIPWRVIGILVVIFTLVGIGLWTTLRKTGRFAKKLRNKN